MATQNNSPLLQTAKSELLKKIEEQIHLRKSLENSKWTQEFITISDIIDGMIFTDDGRIVNILEILPINYAERSATSRDMIADKFGNSFKRLPPNGHIKVMNARTDLTVWERNIRNAMKKETNPKLLERVEDYISHTQEEQKKNSICKRFFFIYEYEGGDDGKKTDVYNDIYFSMLQTQHDAIVAFQNAGNAVINLQSDPEAVAEVFYNFYNPKTCQEDSLQERMSRVNATRDALSEQGICEVYPDVKDYLASRGIKMGKYDFMVMDGVYHTYLTLRDTSYPRTCTAGWLENIITNLPTGDLDIYYRQLDKEMNKYLLDRTDVITRGVLITRSGSGDTDSQEKLATKAGNAKYIKDLLNENQEDLYEVCIIATIRANSYKELYFMKNDFLKTMRTIGYHFDGCFLKTQDFFNMTTPLTYVHNDIFNNNKRNMTNSSLATLYCFTSYEMFTDESLALGTAIKTNTLFGLDNFDSHVFANPHIFISGTTGAGKTFTEDMITSRMRMKNMRVMYILPLKGHEYKDTVESLGGMYIPLRPGGDVCINICEIRPSATADINALKDDDELYEEMKHAPSLLAQKITSLVTWVRMNMGEDRLTVHESNELNAAFTKVYNKFGITEDNMSIWADYKKGILKLMPIIQDLYEGILDIPELKRVASVLKVWIYGNCKNMNGQTNINLDNRTLAFDINEDIIGEELLAAFMYIAFDICYAIAQSDTSEKCAIALDEVWKMLIIEACAKHIFKMIKILRAYKTCIISATQDIEDCMANTFGRALLTLSAIKIFLKVNRDEIKALGESMDLSPQNKELIQTIPVGCGFVCFNTDRILVDFSASLLECELYETDKNKKAEIRQKRLQIKASAM